MISYESSPFLRASPSECVVKPRIIRVTRFTERSVSDFRNRVQRAIDAGQPVIPIVIDSFGGYTYSLFAMVDIIESARMHAKIATIVEGKAMSCGAALLSCGDKGLRFVGTMATVMVHESSAGAIGKISSTAVDLREAERNNASYFDLLDKNAGKKPGHFRRLTQKANNADVFMDAKTCVRHGLADTVGLPQIIVRIAVEFGFGVQGPTKEGAAE